MIKRLLVGWCAVALLSVPALAQILGGGVLSGRSGANYFVDSVNGNDANPGTREQPLQTIGAVTIAEGTTIWLARGSTFHEQLSTAVNHVRVRVYGTGAVPIVDGADAVAGAAWTHDGTLTNTYWIERVSLGSSASTAYQTVWEDGVRLTRAASAAACNSTPASFFSVEVAGADITYKIYIHPTGSTDPATNGSVYEIAERLYAVNLMGDECSVYGPLVVKRCQHHDGVLRMAGDNAYAADVTVSGGRKHNVYLCNGSLFRIDVTQGEESGDFVIVNSKAFSRTAYLQDCTVTGTDTTTGTAFLGHGDTIERIHLKGCDASGVLVPFSMAGGKNTVHIYEDCRAWNIGNSGVWNIDETYGDDNGGEYYIIGCHGRSAYYGIKFANMKAASRVLIYKSYIHSSYTTNLLNTALTMQVDNSIFVGGDYGILGNDAPMAIVANRNIIDASRIYVTTDTSASTSFAGDSNVYNFSVLVGQWKGANYATLATWKAAVNDDASSSGTAVTWTDDPTDDLVTVHPDDVDYTTTAGSPDEALQAGIEHAPASYTPPAWCDAQVVRILSGQ